MEILKFERLDLVPGWKTSVTTILTAVFNLLRMQGWVDLDPEIVSAINTLLLSLIATFVGMKVTRLHKAMDAEIGVVVADVVEND